MEFGNPYFFSLCLIVIGFYLLDFIATFLNVKALDPKLPEQFEGVYDKEEYAKSQAYTRDGARFGLLQSTVSLVALLAFWWGGGFVWLDNIVRGWALGDLGTGLAYIGVLIAASSLLSLPFEIYDTFVIEERYGFNKTTVATFIMDRLKSMFLLAILGVPILALVLYLFGKFSLAWLFAWVAVTVISLVITYLAPRFILPLFNKFQPLEDGELKEEIHSMAERCQFPLTEVSIMDGSKRSAKANAFFTGFGKNKRIALYDTLVENHSVKELVAVLAHEIGHFKRKHIVKQMAIGILQMGLLFFLLGRFLKDEGLFQAFGFAEVPVPSVYLGLIFFSFLFKPIEKIVSIFTSILSRKFEYEADDYAAEHTGGPGHLIQALRTLSKESLSNLTPHPLYVFLYYSHPPVIKRLAALRGFGV